VIGGFWKSGIEPPAVCPRTRRADQRFFVDARPRRVRISASPTRPASARSTSGAAAPTGPIAHPEDCSGAPPLEALDDPEEPLPALLPLPTPPLLLPEPSPKPLLPLPPGPHTVAFTLLVTV
jgi:hypothetical protein